MAELRWPLDAEHRRVPVSAVMSEVGYMRGEKSQPSFLDSRGIRTCPDLCHDIVIVSIADTGNWAHSPAHISSVFTRTTCIVTASTASAPKGLGNENAANDSRQIENVPCGRNQEGVTGQQELTDEAMLGWRALAKAQS